MVYYTQTSDELYHYGVKGMRWGVRRYRNYDGTYTQRGVKRFDAALAKYDAADAKLKSTKTAYKNSQSTKLDVRQAKRERKTAEREVKKHYKQLKQDKLADQGKELYKNNKRITANKQNVAYMALATSVATKALREKGDTKMSNAAAAIGGTITAAYYLVSEYQNRRLRAYYAH